MTMTSSVLFAIILILATSYAAPTTGDVPLVVIPSECEGQRFCTIKPEGYDLLEDQINSLLPEYLIQDYADRMGDKTTPDADDDKSDQDKHSCPTITDSLSPFTIEELNKEEKTRTELVIQTKIFKQKITTVECDYHSLSDEIDKNTPQCFLDVLASPDFDLTSACKQIMGSQILQIYDVEKHKLLNKTIAVPVACSCQTYHISNSETSN